jgi:uncharacterized lipoprotein YmbA
MSRIALVAVAAATALSACSTTVKEAPPVAGTPAYSSSLNIQNVTGSASAANVPAGTAEALTEAVRIELARGPQSGPPANLTFTISDYRVVSKAARFMVGALAGSNRMTVKVSITTPAGAALRQFEVTRAANTMGVGAFMNQKGSLVGETAEAIAKTVRGEKP